MPTDYSLSHTLPLALREGMKAFQDTKADIAAKKKAQMDAQMAQERQGVMDTRYNNEQATKASQFDQEMGLKRQMLAATQQEKAAKRAQGRPLGANTAEELGDRLAIPAELQRNAADVKANPKLLGWENNLLTNVPYAFSERKDVASKVGSIRKLAARAIEGARLTDSDMEYYTKNLPSDTDTPQEFQNKTNNLIGLLSRATGERVGSLGKAGFDVSGYDSDMERLGELGKLTGETGRGAQGQQQGQAEDPMSLAQEIMNDPQASPEDRAWAQSLGARPAPALMPRGQ
jgi:hypothetical protein